MNANGVPTGWADNSTFHHNQERFPKEELWKHAGNHVAFSMDGNRILASAAEPEEVEKQLLAAGIDPSQAVFSYIVPPNVSVM